MTATTYINTTVISPAADTVFKLWLVNWNQPLDGVAASAAKVQHSLPMHCWSASFSPFTTACQSSGRHCHTGPCYFCFSKVFLLSCISSLRVLYSLPNIERLCSNLCLSQMGKTDVKAHHLSNLGDTMLLYVPGHLHVSCHSSGQWVTEARITGRFWT